LTKSDDVGVDVVNGNDDDDDDDDECGYCDDDDGEFDDRSNCTNGSGGDSLVANSEWMVILQFSCTTCHKASVFILCERPTDGQADNGCATACSDTSVRQQTLSSTNCSVAARQTLPSR